MSIASKRRELYSAAKKYLDIKKMFPKSEIDYYNITDYQTKKIAHEMKRLVGLAGGAAYLEQTFVKVRRTKSAKQFMKDSLLPPSSKGILLAGGEKINSGVKIINGVLHFNRGDSAQALFPLNATSEKTLLKSIEKNKTWIINPENITYIETPGGRINYVSGYGVVPGIPGDEINSLQMTLDYASVLWNKYITMVENGEARSNGRKAAHPKKWSMKLLVERL